MNLQLPTGTDTRHEELFLYFKMFVVSVDTRLTAVKIGFSPLHSSF